MKFADASAAEACLEKANDEVRYGLNWTFIVNSVAHMTHCGLVMPYDIAEHGKNAYCSDMKNNDSVKSQFCTWHDS